VAEALKEDGGVTLAAYRQWRETRERLLAKASEPEFHLFLASEASAAPPEPVLVEFISAASGPRSASGRRFGALAHSILRDAPLDAQGAAIGRFAELNARVLGAPADEAEAARAAVEAALAHPILARARTAVRVHREYPLSLYLDDGRWMEGVIDLAFLENGQWIVVDFKTDADAAPRRAQYERQLQWYAYGLSKLTKIPASAVLLAI
jgi:ATP-dependent exoDNAse (exonuclease V) beta subunit